MFSKACEYAIRATIYIVDKSTQQERVSLKDIAQEIDSPVAFTAKILQQLANHGIIDSVKGKSGGYEINARQLKNIRLADIVKAIDGEDVFTTCGLGLKTCSEEHPCPIHKKFKKIRVALRDMLENTSIQELSVQSKKGLTFLKL